MPRTPAAVSLLTATVGGTLVGLEMARVQSIETASTSAADEGDGPPRVDLAHLLQLDHPPAESRRQIAVTSAAGSCRIIVSESTRIIEIERSALRALPSFIAGLTATTGISHTFPLGDSLGFLLDTETVVSILKAGR